MSNVNFSVTNVTSQQQYQGTPERVMFLTVTTVPCCVCLFINGTMLFTLRSKEVFCDTSRYILLFNLLLADTVHMAVIQILYIIAVCGITLTYPICGVLTTFAEFTDLSPLTLVVMSLERYVAVCYPLRHATIITVRNTQVVVTIVWTFSSLNVVTRVLLLLEFPFKNLETLQMKDVCSDIALLLGTNSDYYAKGYTCFLFLSATVAITSSYIGVMVAARSASTDKASAHKARNTLVLHMVQLGLCLSSTTYNPLLTALSRMVTSIIFVRIHSLFYVCFCIFPRCLSSLIYGIRDQTIRPVLMYHLCYRFKL